jgi:hypothetical protein
MAQALDICPSSEVPRPFLSSYHSEPAVSEPVVRAQKKRYFSCNQCSEPITEVSSLFRMTDDIAPLFANPSSRMFRMLSFTQVLPLSVDIVRMPPAVDGTWFQNFAWTIVICRTCEAHLGWRYDWVGGLHSDLISAIQFRQPVIPVVRSNPDDSDNNSLDSDEDNQGSEDREGGSDDGEQDPALQHLSVLLNVFANSARNGSDICAEVEPVIRTTTGSGGRGLPFLDLQRYHREQQTDSAQDGVEYAYEYAPGEQDRLVDALDVALSDGRSVPQWVKTRARERVLLLLDSSSHGQHTHVFHLYSLTKAPPFGVPFCFYGFSVDALTIA